MDESWSDLKTARSASFSWVQIPRPPRSCRLVRLGPRLVGERTAHFASPYVVSSVWAQKRGTWHCTGVLPHAADNIYRVLSEGAGEREHEANLRHRVGR